MDDLLYYISKAIMLFGRTDHEDVESLGNSYRRNEPIEGIAQATYLLPRDLQRRRFLASGYIDGTPGDYGLVRKAVGNNNFPIFLTAPDAISRDELTAIGNKELPEFSIPRETQLLHAGYYPSAYYADAEGNLYQKSWDLNDYGNSTNRAGTTYGPMQWAANLVDKIGSPTVVTTGFLPLRKDLFKTSYSKNRFYSKTIPATLFNTYNESAPIQDFIESQGFVPYYGNFYGDDRDFQTSMNVERDPIMFTLPPITITAKHKKK